MKKILFVAILLLSLTVCLTSPVWAGGLDDAKAGNTAYQEGNYDEAIKLCTKAIASGELSREDLSKVYNNRGEAWDGKDDSDKAIADYTKAIELDPKFADAYLNRGLALANKGAFDKAIVDFTKVIEIKPNYSRVYYYRGFSWGGKGEYDKAIVDYTKAIELDPKFALAYKNRGHAWEKKGDSDKAIADYKKAVELHLEP